MITRPVNCHGLNAQCDVKTKPVTRAHCNLGPCAEWKVGDWQQVLLLAECQSPFLLLLSFNLQVSVARDSIDNTSWKVLAYGIYTRVVDVSEIERVSAANE